MADYGFQREVRTPYSESLYIIGDDDRDIGRLEVHYPTGMVHATLIVRPDVSESEFEEIANRFIHDVSQQLGVDGDSVSIHVYQGEERGIVRNDDIDGSRNGTGHSN